jgi:hypothetical protein
MSDYVELFTAILWTPTYLSMLVTNISGEEFENRTIVLPYIPPTDKSYTLSLFEQTFPISVTDINRDDFDINAFVSTYCLLPAGEESIQLENC